MVCLDTLRIKNLPKELTDAQKEDFIRHFGASKIKLITSRAKEKSVLYAKFDSNEVAKTVLFRLHQLTILNSRLCVEYAENDILQGKSQLKKVEEPDVSNKQYFKSFVNKLNAFNDSVGFYQPPPSHLKYVYPKANRATINNIAHALATIPRFYTQVLHLMNKMNLPPPFAMPDPRLEPPVRQAKSQQVVQKPVEKQTQESESESELESDEENKSKEIIPQKRTLAQKKVIKRPKFIKPPTNASTAQAAKSSEKPENVFDVVDIQAQRKIELKVTSENLEQKNDQQMDVETTGTIGILHQAKKTEEQSQSETASTENKSENKVITTEELLANQIPSKDLGVLSVFKNYHPGAPTCRLYIKNCAKTVELKDLEFIYNRYKTEEKSDTPSQFDIRLMQEGRMKGQAFVTLDTVEIAQKALKETNGYILKDKPLVVVFARSAAPKK